MNLLVATTLLVVCGQCAAAVGILPATVVSGYTISDNDVNAGTTLEVAQMLQSAMNAGNRTVMFTARNLTFDATLAIAFPQETLDLRVFTTR